MFPLRRWLSAKIKIHSQSSSLSYLSPLFFFSPLLSRSLSHRLPSSRDHFYLCFSFLRLLSLFTWISNATEGRLNTYGLFNQNNSLGIIYDQWASVYILFKQAIGKQPHRFVWFSLRKDCKLIIMTTGKDNLEQPVCIVCRCDSGFLTHVVTAMFVSSWFLQTF